MSKAIAEESRALSIFWLKKHGYLNKNSCFSAGGIVWTFGFSDNKSRIGFIISNSDCTSTKNKEYVKLQYNYTEMNGGKSEMDYRVPLTTTPCNFGGVRYWFVCPLSKNGLYCGRRVGVIYSIGKWFGCRHCGEIAYQTQFEGGKFRIGSVCEPDVDRAFGEIKIKYYKNKPTRRYKRYLRLRKKMDDAWLRATTKFGKIF